MLTISRVVAEPMIRLSRFSACMLANPILSQALRGSSSSVCEDCGADEPVLGDEVRIGGLARKSRRGTQERSVKLEMAKGRIFRRLAAQCIAMAVRNWSVECTGWWLLIWRSPTRGVICIVCSGLRSRWWGFQKIESSAVERRCWKGWEYRR